MGAKLQQYPGGYAFLTGVLFGCIAGTCAVILAITARYNLEGATYVAIFCFFPFILAEGVLGGIGGVIGKDIGGFFNRPIWGIRIGGAIGGIIGGLIMALFIWSVVFSL
jgi:hypothetical protein